jgi:peroxiredoxin-like protein
MKNVHYYNTTIEWKEDRKGIISSSVLPLKIEVATPPEFTKGVAEKWSPEHLFVAACNTCLMTTFLAIAENSNLSFVSFKSDAEGKLETIEGKMLISEITLKPVVEIVENTDQEKAMKVLVKAEANCLISNSMKSKIIFEPSIIVIEKSNVC